MKNTKKSQKLFMFELEHKNSDTFNYEIVSGHYGLILDSVDPNTLSTYLKKENAELHVNLSKKLKDYLNQATIDSKTKNVNYLKEYEKAIKTNLCKKLYYSRKELKTLIDSFEINNMDMDTLFQNKEDNVIFIILTLDAWGINPAIYYPKYEI